MKKFFLIAIGLMGAAVAQAQSLDRTVIASAGDYSSTATAQLSFTVGEMVIQYLSVSGGPTVSQGFQQSSNGGASIQSLSELNVQLSIFPNPFANSIEVKSDNNLDNVGFQMQDALGKTIFVSTTEIAKGKHWKIETSNLASGIYWLSIASGENRNSFSLTHIAN